MGPLRRLHYTEEEAEGWARLGQRVRVDVEGSRTDVNSDTLRSGHHVIIEVFEG